MRKILLGIFAHPDDEALGPVGTLLREVRDGAELHLITLTAGQAGATGVFTNSFNLGLLRVRYCRAIWIG